LGAAPNVAVLKLAERLKAEPVESSFDSTPREPITPPPHEPVAAAPPVVEPTPNAEAARVPSADRGAPRPRQPSAKLGMVLALGLALLIAVALAWARSRSVPTAPAASIAVLPFTDLSPGKDNAYFSDGITDELINTLTHVDGIHVAARTSAFAYRDERSDVREVGRRLGVATVLEGSVRKMGGKIRITAQLANAADGYQLWSESYDREMTDVFAIQEDISREIVSVLRGRLVPAPPVRIAEQSTQDAYDLSLARALAGAGERDSATRTLAAIERKAALGYIPSYEVAKVHLALGHPDEAMSWLERAFDERSHSMAFLRVDPQLAPVRANPRFVRLVSRVNDRNQ
jgi:TolB-like protein